MAGTSRTASNFGIAAASAVLLFGLTLKSFEADPIAGAPASLKVTLHDVRSNAGRLTATLCRKEEDFPSSCTIQSSVPAVEGETLVQFENVPSDVYAFAVFHDEDGDGQLRMNAANTAPEEGFGFSNNAIGPAGPPSFDAAGFAVPAAASIDVDMRYF